MTLTFTKFTLLTASFLFSAIANWIYKLALPLIILDLTGSAYYAASLFGISFIPWVLFSLLGGVFADSFTKSKMLFFGNIVSSIFTLILIFTLKESQFNLFLVYCVVFLLSSIDPLVHPSFQSIIPELVPKEKLVKANSIMQTIENFLSIVGPLFGGGIVTIFGGINTLWLTACFFLIAGICSISIHSEPSEKVIQVSSLLTDIKVGTKYAFQEKVIFAGSLMFLFANLGTNMFEANFMFFMTRNMHITIFHTTIAMSLGGIGSLAGGVLANSIISKYHYGNILIMSTIFAGLSMLCLSLMNCYLSIGLLLGLISFFGTLNVVAYFSLRQQTVPKELLGRVVAITRMMSYASIPVGAWLGGYMLKSGLSMTFVIIVAGSIRMLTGVVASFSPLKNEI